MKFKKILLNDWRQFQNIDIDFHPNVTIITGANGSGKSTILKLLSKHFGWYQPFLGTPILSKEQGVFYYKTVFRPLNKEYQTSHYGHNIHILGNIFILMMLLLTFLFMNKYTAMLNLTCNLGNIPVVKGSISVPIDLFLNMKDCKIFPLILWMRRRLLIVTFKKLLTYLIIIIHSTPQFIE